jgi:hypothetical protein
MVPERTVNRFLSRLRHTQDEEGDQGDGDLMRTAFSETLGGSPSVWLKAPLPAEPARRTKRVATVICTGAAAPKTNRDRHIVLWGKMLWQQVARNGWPGIVGYFASAPSTSSAQLKRLFQSGLRMS